MAVDPEKIRRDVFGRVNEVSYREDWETPSGRPRSAPMYLATIGNSYLQVSKVIKASDVGTIQEKANAQLMRWAEQEVRQRIAEATDSASDAAAGQVEAVRRILQDTLAINDRLDWDGMIDRAPFPPFQFTDLQAPWLPPRPKLAWLRRAARQQWEARCAAIHEDNERDWATRRAAAEAEHRRRQFEFEEAQRRRNDSVLSFRQNFEAGQSDAIEEYVRAVFERSSYPDGFFVEHRVFFEPASHTIVVDVALPNQTQVPDVLEYKVAARTEKTSAVRLKKKDHDELYDSAVKQLVLRTIHEVFEAVYTPQVQAVVVNGWVTAVNRASGNEETSCIISVSAQREAFTRINLARVDPAECIKNLKGLVAGPLSNLAPVRPIMQLDRNDGRFVDGRDVLAGMDATTNLAEVPWEEFEHLVRELFGKLFSSADAEVKITQASRDGGVDAIAFDPDPIRGGKFVIQAKRYNKVVPVSAVRDLYGTMIAEGAVKGILVTTAHYGRDSREFVKDKPVTLIDGANLVYLLEQHGYKVRIETQSRRGRA
jgi:restriction system protein